jgi:hypothetical protein
LTGLALNSLAVYLVVHLLGLPYQYAIVLMISVVPLLVFVLLKFWVFHSWKPRPNSIPRRRPSPRPSPQISASSRRHAQEEPQTEHANRLQRTRE